MRAKTYDSCKIALELVRLDHIAGRDVNADDGANADIRRVFWFRYSGSN